MYFLQFRTDMQIANKVRSYTGKYHNNRILYIVCTLNQPSLQRAAAASSLVAEMLKFIRTSALIFIGFQSGKKNELSTCRKY